ncbi:MAG: alkaline phosphatase family protein [Deltaproteobacteria bacterium]|nr:alkaline phosphatase family protein [Deltaproteobacteria bacterium]
MRFHAGRRRAFGIATILACLAASVLIAPASDADRRVLIIGIDGLNWENLTGIGADQVAPHIMRFQHEGAWGVLESEDPVAGAAIWASLATGKTQTDHGVSGPLMPDANGTGLVPPRLEALPVWDIADARERKSAQYFWPATHRNKVEKDRVPELAAYAPLGLAGRLSYPVEAPEPIDATTAAKWIQGDLNPELALNIRLAAQSLAVVPQLVERAFDDGNRLVAAFMDGVASGRHHDGAARLLGVRQGKIPRPKLTPEYLAKLDEAVGRMIDAAGSDAYVILVSDSIVPPRAYEDELEGEAHPIHGIIGILGPGVPAKRLEMPTVLDLVPTTLAVLGLPIAKDMPGHVLDAAIPMIKLSDETVPSYENLVRRPYAPGGPTLEEGDLTHIPGLRAALDEGLAVWANPRNRYALDLIVDGKTNGAYEEVDQDVRRNAMNAVSHYLCGLLLDAQGKRSEALEKLDAARENIDRQLEALTPGQDGKPPSPSKTDKAMRLLITAVGEAAARIRIEIDAFGAATDGVEWAAARAPDSAPWDLWRARLDVAQGEIERGKARIDAYLEANKPTAAARLLQARIARIEKKPDEVLAALEQGTKEAPDSVMLWRELGVAYYNGRDFEKATRAFKQARKLGDRDARSAFLLASSLNSLRRTDEARAALIELLREEPLDDQAWHAMAQMARAAGDEEFARMVGVYRRAVAEDFAFEWLLKNPPDMPPPLPNDPIVPPEAADVDGATIPEDR